MFDLRAWLGSRFPQGRETGSGWYRASCPFHNESTPSFAVKIPSGNWGCKAVSCGQHGGLVRLVAHVDGLTWKEAYALTKAPNPFNIDEDFGGSEEARRRPSRNGLPGDVVRVSSQRFPAYLADRGYGLQDAEAFGLYFGDDFCEEYKGYLLFPFWDILGSYKTFTARTMGRFGARYRQPDESVVASSLYGVWRLPQLPSVDRVFVVEGQFDVLRMWQLGLPAVGLSTAASTPAQRRQLVEISRQFGAKICVLLDRGEMEAASAEKIAGLLSLQCQTPVYSLGWGQPREDGGLVLPDGIEDPDNLTADVVPILLDKCREIELAYGMHGRTQ